MGLDGSRRREPAASPREPVRQMAATKKQFRPRPKGTKLDKTSQEYKTGLYAAQKGLPLPSSWTFGEVQIFDNNPPKPRQTRHVLKLVATTVTDFDKLSTTKARRLHCQERWASLSPATQFKRNFAPSRKTRNDTRLDEDTERPVFDDLIACARTFNRERRPGQPEALLGCVGKRHHGAGTVRNGGRFALVLWRQGECGGWLPSVYLTAYADGE